MGSVICANCYGWVNPKMSGWQILFGVILILIFIEILGIPGILYLCLSSKKRCPICGRNVYRKKYKNKKRKRKKDKKRKFF
jgi:hypothetical protein